MMAVSTSGVVRGIGQVLTPEPRSLHGHPLHEVVGASHAAAEVPELGPPRHRPVDRPLDRCARCLAWPAALAGFFLSQPLRTMTAALGRSLARQPRSPQRFPWMSRSHTNRSSNSGRGPIRRCLQRIRTRSLVDVSGPCGDLSESHYLHLGRRPWNLRVVEWPSAVAGGGGRHPTRADA
jgi:hypothetical protein